MKTEDLDLGKMVRKVIESKALKTAAVARKAGVSPQRMNGWLKKKDLYVNDLFILSKALDFDFFEPFRLNTEKPQTEARLTLQIEISGEKKEEVMRILKDKDLYNLVIGSKS